MILVRFKVYFAEILQLAVSGGNFSVFLCGLERFRLQKCINGSADFWGHSAVHITGPPFFIFKTLKTFLINELTSKVVNGILHLTRKVVKYGSCNNNAGPKTPRPKAPRPQGPKAEEGGRQDAFI